MKFEWRNLGGIWGCVCIPCGRGLTQLCNVVNVPLRTVLCVFGTCEGVESEDVAADDFRYRRI